MFCTLMCGKEFQILNSARCIQDLQRGANYGTTRRVSHVITTSSSVVSTTIIGCVPVRRRRAIHIEGTSNYCRLSDAVYGSRYLELNFACNSPPE